MPLFKRCRALVLVTFATACSNTVSPTQPGVTVTAGTWNYVLSVQVPLPNPPGPSSCVPPNATGTTVVSSSGAFTIPFAGLTCSNCAMGGTVTGTVVPTGVSGSVTASITGGGCSVQQPTPSPGAMSGACTSTGCSVGLTTIGSYVVSYTLTPP